MGCSLHVQGLKQMQLYVGSRKGDPAAGEVSEYVSHYHHQSLCTVKLQPVVMPCFYSDVKSAYTLMSWPLAI